MKEKQTKMKKKKFLLTAIAGVAVVGIVLASVVYQSVQGASVETVYKETIVEKGNLIVGVTESGSVSIGTLTQDIEFEQSTTASSSQQNGGSNVSSSSSQTLKVEEVYVSTGQKIAVNDALMKLSTDSVESYRTSLKEAVKTAELAVSAAYLSSEKQKLEAGYTYNQSVASGSVAEEEYQNTIAQLQEDVDEAQEKVDESQGKINYYQTQINAGVDLSSSLAEEQKNYQKLLTKLQSAENAYITKSIQAEADYQKALLASENASSQYSVDVSGADSSISSVEDDLADAKEVLAEFEAFVGTDGTIYSEYAGTVMEVGYAAGDELSSQTSVVTVTDETAVTMTVSVSQEDISAIAIGDIANIALTAYEDTDFVGEVLSMDTSTSSGSSTVSYNVTVLFTGDISGVYADMTGNVTFIEKQVEDVLYVSNKAIINEGTASYVKVKDADGTIRQVQVITGFSDGISVEITDGITEGETVLIESQVAVE